MMKILCRVFKDSLDKKTKAYILKKDNEYSIAEYFGKQGAVVGEWNRIMIDSLIDLPFLVRIESVT